MNTLKKPSLKTAGAITRKSITVTQESLVELTDIQHENGALRVIQPAVEGTGLIAWAACHKEFIEAELLKHGAILFRGFNMIGISDFEEFIENISGELLEYNYQSTPRHRVSGKIYTSTEYPQSYSIPLHNEMAYSREWPMKIWFFCQQPAEHGGETPIADSRKVFDLIDSRIRERFTEKKVMYARNYGDGLDLSWQTVFQTDSKSEVEGYCNDAGIGFEWRRGNRLTTRQICPAVAQHPVTKEMVWFNQAHLFHISNLEPGVREYLLAAFKQDECPRNAYYGDGTPIEISALEEIREAYNQTQGVFAWKKGDLLMLDNMLAAHGRKPFSGSRKIVVGMAQPHSGYGIK